MSDMLLQSQEGRVVTLTLNRPERRNALNLDLVERLREALGRLDQDPEVGCIVITGAGDRAFCSGGDLSPEALRDGIFASHEGRRDFGQLLLQMRKLGTPLLAKVNGYALGGGLGLVMACDLAVAVESARFGTPELERGLFPWMISALMLRSLPDKSAREMIFTCEKIGADRALQLGLLSRVVRVEDLELACAELAATVASKSKAIVRLGKRALAATADQPLEAALETLSALLTVNTLCEDAAEGVSAFIEKRPPHWKGR